jgi:deoxyhypusine synthase
MGHTYSGDFYLQGRDLRLKGQNRIGNMIVPNSNYCAFEDFMNPILDAMLDEQKSKGINWTPSKMVRRLGECINNEDSVYYWCVSSWLLLLTYLLF